MRPVGPQDVYMVITAVMKCLLESLENNAGVDERMRGHFWIILRCLVSSVCLWSQRGLYNCWYIFRIFLYGRQFFLDWNLVEVFHSWPLDNNFFLSSCLLAICLLCCKHARLCNPTFNYTSAASKCKRSILWTVESYIVILTWLQGGEVKLANTSMWTLPRIFGNVSLHTGDKHTASVQF